MLIFLDLASRTGIAHDGSHRDKPITYLLKLPRAEGNPEEGYEYGAVYSALRAHLVGMIATLKPDAIGFEAAISAMGANRSDKGFRTTQHTTRLLFGLVAVVEEVCDTMQIRYYEAHVASIRKHFCGTARADKAAVIKACSMYGVDIGEPYPDDNRADAAAGWSYVSWLRRASSVGAATPLFAR